MKYIKIPVLIGAAILMISATTVTKDKLFEITKNIELFVSVYQYLNEEYVDDLDPSEVMKTGITAMMNSMDPYTKYWSGNEIESYRLNDGSKYQGLGCEIVEIDGAFYLKNMKKKSAAVKAGLKAGDEILALNNNGVVGRSLEEVNMMSLGVPGTDLNIRVKREGQTQDVSVKRGSGATDNVPYYGMLDEEIAYITLTEFSENASNNIRKAYASLKDDHELKGLVLDLRFNPGGRLNEAIALSNLFIPRGKEVVSVRGKIKENDKSYKTKVDPMDLNIPIVVMINNKSASASEIVSGVLQDYDRGVVMGQRSYGKGLVQRTHKLGYNSQMKLTISKYYIPSGRCIQSVQYLNGEPVDIPDEERSKFKTANGRTVLDGGGVTPDVKLERKKESKYVEALKKDNVIFRFVNEYVAEIDTIEDAKAYTFDAYPRFEKFVEESGYSYKSDIGKRLHKLATKEESKYSDEIIALQEKIDREGQQDLVAYKDEITKLIEQELVSRFQYRSGMAANRLNGDTEIQEAMALLKDKKRYMSILSK